ncbi:ead/Ea22-like family protein [Cronobacter sakazakii]|uniref:ead/Ea22-like family protein n=1 Tax=Cronobacter sakazakii TaxID=28141 RepID=UPI000B3DA942|nr:ead/Ea22-like family protein [Cronobacter sakazakii]ELY3812385.1 ead/Ea22-like family protein [Cronobacter sakazakii]PUW92938.1 hypothetical protein CCQ26_04480 [Cronobacter sakazakii]
MNTSKLKAAAEKARWGDWSAYKPHSGARGYEVLVGSEAVAQHCLKDDAAFIAEASPKTVLCLIAALEAAEKRGADMEVACELFAESKLAQIKLEAALEKAQQRVVELENDEVRQRLANAEHQLYLAELAKNNLRASRKAQFKKRKAAEARIAELEARTVKLPPCVDDLHGVGMVMSADAVTEALSAAGINLETGGE